MKHRKLRIAWSVAWGMVAGLVVCFGYGAIRFDYIAMETPATLVTVAFGIGVWLQIVF